MEGIIKVTPSTLINTATAFQTTGTQIRNLTGQMTTMVTSLSGQVWSGEAATAYKNKFNGLQDDIEKMIRMIDEHVSDLQEMARGYESAESQNESLASTLSSDVIV